MFNPKPLLDAIVSIRILGLVPDRRLLCGRQTTGILTHSWFQKMHTDMYAIFICIDRYLPLDIEILIQSYREVFIRYLDQ